MSDIQKYKVSSAENLWEPITISVLKDIIIESNVKKGIEIGSSFESMKKYWNSFSGENAYIVTPIIDTEI